MNKIRIIAILGLLSILQVSKAQDTDENPPKVLIMGVPQYLLKNGLRFDFEMPSKDYKSWWVFSPQFYIDVNNNNLDSWRNKRYESLHGFGLSIHRKGFLSKRHVDKGVYISGGMGFQNFNIKTSGDRWVEIIRNGSTYMELVPDSYHLGITKVMTEALIGYQKEITSRLYIDFYAGVGLRYSFYEQPSGSTLKFNKNITDYGYTGTAFIAGIRLGVGL